MKKPHDKDLAVCSVGLLRSVGAWVVPSRATNPTLKVYVGFSSRKFSSDLKYAYSKGFVSRTPHFNWLSNYLANPERRRKRV
jgi:hypothetical protein